MAIKNLAALNDQSKNAGGGTRDGYTSYQITGSFIGTISFECQLDGSTWVPIAAIPAAVLPYGAPVTSTSAPGAWVVYNCGFTVRARMSAFTSGTAIVNDNPVST